ncbi:hypothetical protein RSOL_008880, partial [Rhizoctonia solani AG-3 Rhs1AP]
MTSLPRKRKALKAFVGPSMLVAATPHTSRIFGDWPRGKGEKEGDNGFGEEEEEEEEEGEEDGQTGDGDRGEGRHVPFIPNTRSSIT